MIIARIKRLIYKWKQSSAARDLTIIVILAIVLYSLAILFDGYESLTAWLERFEIIQLDELFFVMPILLFALIIFAFRRWRELSVLHMEREELFEALDMTDIRLAQIESELAMSELKLQRERVQLLEDILNDLSHDIKTPLSSIQTFVYLFNKSTDPTKQKYYLSELEKQVKRLARMVEDILAMTRLEKGDALSLTPTDLNELILSVIEGHRHRIDEKAITFKIDLDTTIPAVLAHETELTRAIANLVENAVTYTPQGGSVSVRTYQEAMLIGMEIKDTGMGISEADRKQIFERFFRADEARSSNEGGTGLGLSIVKRTVDLHGGQIEVESEPNQGSLFRLFLKSA